MIFTKNKNNQNRFFDLCVYLLGIVIFCICLYQLVSIFLDYHNAKAEYTGLQSYIEMPKESETIQADEQENYPHIEIDEEQLKLINADYTAWIYIPSLDISYPIVQGQDNDHYLQLSFEGNSFHAGCIFMDAAAANDLTDRNTFIYGHNMKDGSMFGKLKKFRTDENLCSSNPYFYLYEGDQIYTYQIFAYAVIAADSELYTTISSDEDYDAYYEKTMLHNQYNGDSDADIDWTTRPNIVSLSTCAGNGNTRFLVQGALVKTDIKLSNKK